MNSGEALALISARVQNIVSDTTFWAGVGGTVTVAAAVYGIHNQRETRLAARRAAEAAFKAQWSMSVLRVIGDVADVAVTCGMIDPGLRVESAIVTAPRGAKAFGNPREERGARQGGTAQEVVWSRRLEPARTRAAGGETETLEFSVTIPRKPWFSRQARTRLSVTLILEEVFGTRRQIAIPLRSEPLDWPTRPG